MKKVKAWALLRKDNGRIQTVFLLEENLKFAEKNDPYYIAALNKKIGSLKKVPIVITYKLP